MTPLSKYLDRHKMSGSELARRAGISRNYVSQIATGVRNPNWRTAVRLERATEGEVQATDLMPHVEEDNPVAACDQSPERVKSEGPV